MENITVEQIIHFLEVVAGMIASIGVISNFIFKKYKKHMHDDVTESLVPIYKEIEKINQNYNKNRHSYEEGMKCLLRNDILNIYLKCKNEKRITIQEKQSINKCYELYHEMKGNSFVKDIVEEMNTYEVIN